MRSGDARYVINEIQVGGYDATRLDFDIPARHGVRQTIGDTLGIGGNAAATLTTTRIVAMCDDLLDAHKALLPAGLIR